VAGAGLRPITEKKPVTLTHLKDWTYDSAVTFGQSRTPPTGWLDMSSRTPSPHFLLRGLAVPVVSFVAIGFLIAQDVLRSRELQATPPSDAHDPDSDGLVNAQEDIIGSNSFEADTDHDGLTDLEELARKSSPLFDTSLPAVPGLSLGMTARGGEEEEVHALIAMYLPDGKLRNKDFRAGILMGGRTVAFSQAYLLNEAQLSFYPAQDSVARIALLDLPIPSRYVLAFGQMTMFATLGDAAAGVVQTADSIHLLSFGQEVVLEFTNPSIKGGGSTTASSQPTGGPGSRSIGSVYIPLPMRGGVSNWLPGQVCFQQTALIGVSGAKITQEVTSAECQLGWDSYCPGTCSATVGNTYTTIDPLALIGG